MSADDPRSEERLFPIVGIGASAGGLEALDVFLRNVPAKSGIAFVIVQHLDPTQKDFMVELLQRATAMKVIQVKDRTVVRPACVYVIPPNKDMSILHGVLHLLDRIAPHGLHLPIDFFLRSLADDQQERSVGVILSGMGSDGTLGLRAIKEKGGATFVQEPASAKFDGMPQKRDRRRVWRILWPRWKTLPGKIIAYLQRAPLVAKSGLGQADKARSGLEKSSDSVAGSHRPRLLPLQEHRRLSPDRAAHGHPSDRQDRDLRPFLAGESAGSGICCSRSF